MPCNQIAVIHNCLAEGLLMHGSLGYLSGNSTSERSETATAHTAERWHQLKKNCTKMINV